MSLSEPAPPYFLPDPRPQRKRHFLGARLTSAGNYRLFPLTLDSPHEPWCLHFEWGPCSCAPEPGETFLPTPA